MVFNIGLESKCLEPDYRHLLACGEYKRLVDNRPMKRFAASTVVQMMVDMYAGIDVRWVWQKTCFEGEEMPIPVISPLDQALVRERLDAFGRRLEDVVAKDPITTTVVDRTAEGSHVCFAMGSGNP